MTRLVFASLLIGLSPWAMAAAEVANPSAVVATYPTGVAISDLGDFTQQELTDRARTALVRGGAYGGLQPGIAQAPAAGLYMALSIFMGGVDAPHDLTAPSEALK